MLKPDLPPDEASRLAALQELEILDSDPSPEFDRITELAVAMFQVPIALVSLVDRNRQWFKSCVGLEVRETSRDTAFCAHAILGQSTLLVPDASRDPRFRDNPLVRGDPNIRFYAGRPLRAPSGHCIGTLCLIDRVPRELTREQLSMLDRLAAVVEGELANLLHRRHEFYELESARIRARLSQVLQARQPLTKALVASVETLGQIHGLSEENRGCILLDRQAMDSQELLITHPSCRWQIEPSSRLLAYMYSILALGRDNSQVIVSLTSPFLKDSQTQLQHGHYVVPIRHGDTSYGILLLVCDSAPCDFPARLSMLELVGQLLGVTIADHQAMREMLRARGVAEEASKIKSQFLANMSHEIRTPMYGVLGMLDLLEDAPLSDLHRSYLRTAHQSGQMLLQVINDILDLSRIEAGELVLETTEFNVGTTVEEVVTLLSERAARKDVELLCHISRNVPTTAKGDPGRLNQVLMNLVGNAVKFTEHGEISVWVDATGEPDGRVLLTCAVKDTGIGIAEEVQRRLFEPFSQADGSTTRRYGGSGLGLAISKQLVEKMGGHIELSSALGEGSTFRFQVPLKDPDNKPPPRHSMTGRRVLIADDNANNRLILSSYLERWQLQCSTAVDGFDALRQLQSAVDAGQPWPVAIIDLQMPGMDGLELARRIRRDPRLAGTGLLLLSSVGQPLAEMEHCGIDKHLHKPVHKTQLYLALTALFGEQDRVDTAIEMRGALPPAAAPGNDNKDAPPAPGELRGHVLLAEDDEVAQQVSLSLLRRLGLHAELARDGREAVAAVAARHFDLVLMDCQMPQMSGLDAARAIRERERRTGDGRQVPIIALTASAMKGQREICLSAGMDDYLTKPLSSATLQIALRRWLGNAPAAAGGAPGEAAASGESDACELDAHDELLVDRRRLQELREWLGDQLPALVTSFEETGQSLMNTLRSATDTSNLEVLAASAHQLKGSCSNLGAAQLAECCVALEEQCRGGELADAAERVERIAATYRATCDALHRLMK